MSDGCLLRFSLRTKCRPVIRLCTEFSEYNTKYNCHFFHLPFCIFPKKILFPYRKRINNTKSSRSIILPVKIISVLFQHNQTIKKMDQYIEKRTNRSFRHLFIKLQCKYTLRTGRVQGNVNTFADRLLR